jgi:hypothetical protein
MILIAIYIAALILFLSGGNAIHKKGKEWDEYVEGGRKLNDFKE